MTTKRYKALLEERYQEGFNWTLRHPTIAPNGGAGPRLDKWTAIAYMQGASDAKKLFAVTQRGARVTAESQADPRLFSYDDKMAAESQPRVETIKWEEAP